MPKQQLYPDYATGAGDGPALWNDPAFQKASAKWADEHGREPATDSDFAEISQIMADMTGESANGPNDASTDPDHAPEYDDNEGPPISDRNPKKRIPPGMTEDSMPMTDQYDYVGGDYTGPVVDHTRDPTSMGFDQSIMQPGVDLNQIPMDGGLSGGGPQLPGTFDMLVKQMMGPNAGGGQYGPLNGTVAAGAPPPPFDETGMNNRSRMTGRDPRAGGGMDPNMIQQLLQKVLGR